MRNLPINDPKWVKENIVVLHEYRYGGYRLGLKNLMLVSNDSYRPDSYDDFIVFQDAKDLKIVEL